MKIRANFAMSAYGPFQSSHPLANDGCFRPQSRLSIKRGGPWHFIGTRYHAAPPRRSRLAGDLAAVDRLGERGVAVDLAPDLSQDQVRLVARDVPLQHSE